MTFSETYHSLITEASLMLVGRLNVQSTPAVGNTHGVVEVTGWQNADTISALATYLVALRAGVIDQAGRLCCELIGSPREYSADLLHSVEEIIVQPADSGESITDWKSKWRNPWIAEGIWHCCMFIAMRKADLHPHGSVIAVDFSHVSPKDHGLDVTALYVKENGSLGISFVETKAYRNDPNGAIGDAVDMFKAIEAGKHDTRLRQLITSFRSVIGEPHSQQLSYALWKDERTLIPNPHYESNEATVRWSRRRTASFSGLTAPVVIMPHGVSGFDAFFDTVANEMRRKAEEVAAHV